MGAHLHHKSEAIRAVLFEDSPCCAGVSCPASRSLTPPGPPQHGLYSQKMALITSDHGIICPLIINASRPQAEAQGMGGLGYAGAPPPPGVRRGTWAPRVVAGS